MKALLIIAVSSMALSGYSFVSAPQKEKGQTVTISKSSQASDFGYFRAHRQGRGVALAWSITSLDGVTGFAVERSYDNDYFEVANTQATNNSLKHAWKDESVFPGYIYYRIVCMMSDGTVHYSEVRTVRIVQHG